MVVDEGDRRVETLGAKAMKRQTCFAFDSLCRASESDDRR
jgi:hypothetical protein